MTPKLPQIVCPFWQVFSSRPFKSFLLQLSYCSCSFLLFKFLLFCCLMSLQCTFYLTQTTFDYLAKEMYYINKPGLPFSEMFWDFIWIIVPVSPGLFNLFLFSRTLLWSKKKRDIYNCFSNWFNGGLSKVFSLFHFDFCLIYFCPSLDLTIRAYCDECV